MKAWVKILQEMFEETDFTYSAMINKYPERTKKDMIKTFKEEGLTVNALLEYLPYRDVVNKQFNTFEELFELEIRGFEYRVLNGGNKEKEQLGIEDIVKFSPKIIK